MAVSYAAPTVTGGTAPVNAPACTPASGSAFGVGSTTVQCVAQDADARTASCSFSVTVTPPPQLQKTKFLAFGDSLTAGGLSPCPFLVPGSGPLSFEEDAALIRASINQPISYPSQLQQLLASRYTAQTPSVVNEGVGGEMTSAGASRLPGLLSLHQPEVLLLTEGINDIHNPFIEDSIPVVVENLRQMIRDAHARATLVYLGTLLPQRLDACRNFATAATISEANSQIRAMGLSEGARIVDLHAAFVGKENTHLGLDGLHPNEAGYALMAETFFAAIRVTLEVAPSSAGS